MCVYSAYVSEVNKQWPGITQDPPPFGRMSFPGVPMMTPTTDPRILQEILDIGKRLDRIDKALGLKDCTQEAAAKKAFEDRLTKLIEDAKFLKQSVECDSGKCEVNSSAPNSSYLQQLTGASAGNTTTYIGTNSPAGQALGSASGKSMGDWSTGKTESGLGAKGFLSGSKG